MTAGPLQWGRVVLPPFSEMSAFLCAAQNTDGGWGYGAGSSWTEATAFALLALRSNESEKAAESCRRGLQWLSGARRADGGWGPQPSVHESTWVTSLVVFVLRKTGYSGPSDPAVAWLLGQSGQESTMMFRLRRFLLGIRPEYEGSYHGWPWYPGAAAWVGPTVFSVLALCSVVPPGSRSDIDARVEQGRRFLFSHMCSDGGWNHGSSRALGYEGPSYPETTGLALLALRGGSPALPERVFQCAARHLETCRSFQALVWLQLGLLAHGRLTASSGSGIGLRRWSVLDAALAGIAHHAVAGRQLFGG